MTLRQKFSVLVFGCAVLTALVLSLFSYVQLKNSLMNNINSEVHATAVGQAGKIKEWKESKEATIKSLVDLLEDRDVTLESLQQATTAGRFELGYFGSETGEMFQNDPTQTLPADYDPRKRPWYGDAKKSRDVIFTAPYVGASANHLMITAAQSVYRNGKLIGVAGADIPLEAVTQGVLDIELGGEGRAILTNKAGLILADSIEQNRNKSLKDVFGFDLTQLSTTELSDVNGHFVSKFDINGSDWTIVFVLDKGHVLAPLSQLLVTLIIAAVIVALIVSVIMSMLSSRLLSGVTRVNQVLKEISQGQGDLTVRIPVNSDDEIGQLGKHFNTFLGSMSALVTEIKTMSTTLNSLAHQSKDQAVQSQKELKDQLDEITMVATAVSQMSSATHEIASNAENTAGASQEAARNTHEGSRVVSGSQQEIQNLANEVTQASDIISNLDVHVQGISSILLTIQDIAEKTNLLALNAAIEAARAGEQGRGFAVVADEVRVLSQRTQSSTEEIRDKIEGLNSVTSRAVASMKRSTGIAEGAVSEAMSAASALESIQSSVQKISDMAMQIASAAEEQNIVTHDISNNSASIKEISEKLSKEASSTAKAAEQFATLADRLEQQIARFIV